MKSGQQSQICDVVEVVEVGAPPEIIMGYNYPFSPPLNLSKMDELATARVELLMR